MLLYSVINCWFSCHILSEIVGSVTFCYTIVGLAFVIFCYHLLEQIVSYAVIYFQKMGPTLSCDAIFCYKLLDQNASYSYIDSGCNIWCVVLNVWQSWNVKCDCETKTKKTETSPSNQDRVAYQSETGFGMARRQIVVIREKKVATSGSV